MQNKEIEKLEELSHYCALKNIDREDNIFGEFVVAIQKVRNYIDQLENKVKKSEIDKQKLIEKLEEVLKEYEHIKANEDSAMNLYSEIRKIAKGEKE